MPTNLQVAPFKQMAKNLELLFPQEQIQECKDEMFERLLMSAIYQLTTGEESAVTASLKIEENVMYGMNIKSSGNINRFIETTEPEIAYKSLFKTFEAMVAKRELAKRMSSLDSLLESLGIDVDELESESKSDDDVSVNTEASVANDTQKPEDQRVS